MSRCLRIAIAEDEAFMQNYFRETLRMMGHEVVSVAATGRELVQHCCDLHPDLVITDIKMPDMDGLDAATEIYASGAVPIIVVSAYHDPELIERAERNHVAAYLVKPIKQDDLEPAIAIAMRRFEEFREMCRQANGLRQALEDRKTIERAKGILMKRTGLDEPAAFKRLQKLATEKGRKLVEIAQMVLLAEEAFQASDKS